MLVPAAGRGHKQVVLPGDGRRAKSADEDRYGFGCWGDRHPQRSSVRGGRGRQMKAGRPHGLIIMEHREISPVTFLGQLALRVVLWRVAGGGEENIQGFISLS